MCVCEDDVTDVASRFHTVLLPGLVSVDRMFGLPKCFTSSRTFLRFQNVFQVLQSSVSAQTLVMVKQTDAILLYPLMSLSIIIMMKHADD